MKTCTKCGESKPVEEFYSHPQTRDERSGSCKTCDKAAAAVRYSENPERAKAASAAWYRANPERAKDAAAARYRENPEKAKAAAAAWQKANPEKRGVITAAWRRAHLDLYSAYQRARGVNVRSARLLSPDEKQETREWVKIISEDTCSYCGEPVEHIDHITPVSRGGDGLWTNLTASCAHHNMRKKAKPLLMFLYDRTLDENGESVLPYEVGS